jgi:uncharacterized membrane protein
MSGWYERALEEIERDYDEGNIDAKEYQAQMRDLHAELREEASDNAERAYNDTMGC